MTTTTRLLNKLIQGKIIRNHWIVGILFLCIVVTGCEFLQYKGWTEKDFVGVWKQDSKDCEDNLPNCAQFEFRDDGKFIAKNIPEDYLGYGINTYLSKRTFSATGEWDIEVDPEPLRWDKINLTFNPVTEMNYPSYHRVIFILGGKGNYHLWSFMDPDGEGIEFSFVSSKSGDK